MERRELIKVQTYLVCLISSALYGDVSTTDSVVTVKARRWVERADNDAIHGAEIDCHTKQS